jgi:ubiquinone/menaquinone biosynthesis C-methylase UbiE
MAAGTANAERISAKLASRGAPSFEPLSRQYKDASNLQARSDLHARFQTNRYGWMRWIFDHFDFPANCHVLDVGCGDGRLWDSNRQRIGEGWYINLMDFSAGMIAEARRRLGDQPFDVRFVVADAHGIPFQDRSFDAVIANHMLYHLSDLDRGMREIRRVLKPGGSLYASTNGLDHMRELRDLVRPFAPDLPFVAAHTAAAFGLENGADRLARHFAQIERHHYEDSLAVTETAPLFAYVLSVLGARDALSDAAIARLHRQIDERIAVTGVFRITKSQGLFVARRAGA